MMTEPRCHVLLFMIGVLLGSVSGSGSPNIIIVVADDLGWSDVGFHGSTQIPTPNLDALAYDGVMLNNYYVEQICTPSRAALMTGRYPIHTGLQSGVISGSKPYGLGLNETLLPQYLKQVGYKTHMIGKWHLGFVAKEYTPMYRGFDSFLGFIGGKDDYWDHSRYEGEGKPKNSWGLDFYDGNEPKKDAFGRYSTDVYTERAAQLIREHDVSQPFFLYYPQQAVHNANANIPLEAPYAYMKKFSYIKDMGRRTYAAMLSSLDDSMGNLTAELHAKGMLENSVIIFTTDNGGPAHGFSSNHASNFPLRGMKYTRWEGGVRGCSFVWSPLLKNTPRVSDALMHITDLLPSMLHVSGFNTSTLKSLDGFDQWEALSQDVASQREEVMLGIDPLQEKGTYAHRMGDYKIIWSYPARDGWYKPEGVDIDGEVEGDKDDPPPFPFPKPSDSVAGKVLISMGRGQHLDSTEPLTIHCGPKPANATTNCQPYKKPCVFNIIKDPCEYNNIAEQNKELETTKLIYGGDSSVRGDGGGRGCEVRADGTYTIPEHKACKNCWHSKDVYEKLLERVQYYNSTMVKPRNKPYDPAGNPPMHGGIWKPWRTLEDIVYTEW